MVFDLPGYHITTATLLSRKNTKPRALRHRVSVFLI